MSEPVKLRQLTPLHSEELQDVVGRPPGGIIRWGTSMIFVVLIIMLSVGILVKYADVLSGPFLLSASNAPKSVIAHTDGKLQALFVKERDSVRQGQVLAYMESNANHPEVIKLSEDLQHLWLLIQDDKWENIAQFHPADYKHLGELQSAYQQFIVTYIQLDAFLKKGMYVQKKKLLGQELINLDAMHQNYLSQQKIYQQALEIAEEHLSATKKMYEEKVVPLLDYKKEIGDCLSKKLPIENLNQTLTTNENDIANKQQEMVQLEQQFNDQKGSFLQALNTLTSNTDDWKKKFLLTAPVAGLITWPTLLQVAEDVKNEQELFYVTPFITNYYGEVKVAQENFGKLQLNQQVLITLDGYPYQEYGKLTGIVNFISKMPDKNGQYYAAVNFSNGLITDRNMPVNFQNGLSGTAEIITQKTRLIYKMLYTMREVLYKPKPVTNATNNNATSINTSNNKN
ncbi:HlyD family efflux transporter periplasmic adaptor subunit [Chitinophagaceae bacterium LWZ2-11]